MKIDSMKSPTTEQYKAFGEHVFRAHSWYKHLPVFGGEKFYFFLSENAGSGYTNERPRMHYGWKTHSEYQERFGPLDYVYELHGESNRDSQSSKIPQLTENILQNSIQLTAFVAAEEPDIIARRVIEQSGQMPQMVKSWLNALGDQDKIWNQLTREERDLVFQKSLPFYPERVLEYFAASEHVEKMFLPLMEKERRKVFDALENLRKMELANETVWFE